MGILTQDELATIRAALRFWRDEMASANELTTRHYFDISPHRNLSAEQISALIARLRSDEPNF